MLSWPIDAIAHNAKCPAVIFHALLHITLHMCAFMFSSYILRKKKTKCKTKISNGIIIKKVANKRGRKDDKGVADKSGVNGCITVERLSANVEGNCQKYSRIGHLTLVRLEKEPTLENIKSACKAHFGASLECDVLAGERGPSFSHTDQIDLSKTFCHKTQKFNAIKLSHATEVPVNKFKSMVSPAVFQSLYQLAQC